MPPNRREWRREDKARSANASERYPPQLALPNVAIGVYVAIVYFAAMLSSQWGAALVRRWGPIRTSQCSLVLAAIGSMLTGSGDVRIATAGAVLLGLGYGPVTPASSDMLARTTPPERQALVFSIKQTGVPLGGLLAGVLVPPLLEGGGVSLALAAVSVLCLVALACAQPLRADLDAGRDARASPPTMARLLQPVRMVLAHRTLRGIALCTLVLSAVQVSLSSYVVTSLTTDLGWNLWWAGVGSSLAHAAGVAGRIAWGWLADVSGRARGTLAGLAIGMAVCGLLMVIPDASTAPGWVLALLLAYGACALGWNGVFLAMVAREVPHDSVAAATAGCLFFTFLGVVIGPPLFGGLATLAGSLSAAFAWLALPLLATIVLMLRAGRPRGLP